MSRPMQPVNKGVDAKGELVWKFVPMKAWQIEMIAKMMASFVRIVPMKYRGDFLAFWMKRVNYWKTGQEHEDVPSMEIRDGAYSHLRTPRNHHKGD